MNLIPGFIRQRIAHRPNLLRIVDNIGWLFFDKMLRMGVGLIVGVWVARYLGPQQLGLLDFAAAFTSMFAALAGLGLQGIVVRDLVRSPQRAAETLGSAAALLFAGGVLSYGLLMVSIWFLRPDDSLSTGIVAILGSMTLFKASEVVIYRLEAQVQSKYAVWIQNGVFLTVAAIKVVMIVQQATLMAFAWITMAEALVVALLLASMIGLRDQRLWPLRFQVERAGELLKDSWPLMLAGIAVTLYMKIDQIMLGEMIGNEAVGVYGAATRISEVWYFIPLTIVASLFPSILELKDRDSARYHARLQRLYDLMVWLSLLIAVPMTFLSTRFVTLLYGEAYADAGLVLAIHIWASVFVFLGVASSRWLVAENLQLLSLQRTALGAVTNVALNYVLIPDHGPAGAAAATVISYAIAALFADVLQARTRPAFRMKLRALNVFGSIKRSIRAQTQRHPS